MDLQAARHCRAFLVIKCAINDFKSLFKIVVLKAGNKLKKYIEKRYSLIDSFFSKPKQKFVAEDYHRLRVEIKKMNAAFKLISYCAKKFNRKKYDKLYRDIFKQAGKIREMQMQESVLKKFKLYKTLKGFILEGKQLQKAESAKFFALVKYRKATKLRRNKNQITSFLKQLNKDCIEGFFIKQRKKINAVSGKKNLTPAEIHKLRKLIKDFRYMWKLFFPERSTSSRIDFLTELIGKWHDYDVVGKNLHNAIATGNMIHKEADNLREVAKKINLQANAFSKNIISACTKSNFISF
ncbi:MAG TPA: CHAD domain-containing protein [Puia sp.]|nr:CHAD domain-containing protein [Puia sp.]